MSKKQGTTPSEGGVVPEEAVRDKAADAREAATADAAQEEAGAGGRAPAPGEPADAEVGRSARRARKRRAQAEKDPAPGAAGGAGSKRKEAEANAERPGGEDPERPVAEDDDADEVGGGDAEEDARAADAEDDAASDTEQGRAGGRARRRSAETTTASRRASRRRDAEDEISVRAQAKYVRTAPRKARLVIEHIRGRPVEEARAILLTTPRAASRDVLKLLDSCVANAENNHELSADELRVEKAYVDEGPTLKRYRPRALGRATRIRKRTSHMTIYLTNREGR
jgi:large subunit ribosomal protein L22